MSTVINYQLRAHMSLLAHIDNNTSFSQTIQLHPCRSAGRTRQENIFGLNEALDMIADDFWNSTTSPSPIDINNDETLTKVTTDIRISLKKPSPTLEQDSEEFKRQAKEIKKDIQRISKYKNRHARKKSKSPSQPEQDEKYTKERLKYEHEFRRRVSVNEGREFLLDFIQYHFAEHVENITIKNTKTLEEIKMIGNEELAIGVRQCRRLFNAPVISDQVGLLLWQELRQGDRLDHSHEFRTSDEAERDNIAPEVVSRKWTEELEKRKDEYIAERQAAVSGGALQQKSSQKQNLALDCSSHPATSEPSPVESHATPTAPSEPGYALAEHVLTSIPMEKKALDGFLEGVKKSAVKGATHLAASLASGYA